MRTQRVILSSLAAAVRDSPAGCAALVALNQPHHLPAFDRVVHLEHGRVRAVRSVAEVLILTLTLSRAPALALALTLRLTWPRCSPSPSP